MQRVTQRAAQASKQAKRKAKAVTEKDRMYQRKSNREEKFYYQRNILDEARREREHRREDWMLGPLAPRRDVGKQKSVYGSVPTTRLQFPTIDVERRRRYINIMEGDRVCAITGRDKGKIGKVTSVDEEKESLTVEGLNIYDMEFPSFLVMKDNDRRPYRPYSLPFGLDDVRLVVPLENPETGAPEDVVVENVYGGQPILERRYGSSLPKHTRYIKGLDVAIPWPKEEESEFKDEDPDTTGVEVEHASFVPELKSFPFPSTVIDELRNKYSKFRTRHDPRYVAKMQRIDAIREFKKSRTLLTPQAEYQAKEAEKRAAEREAAKDESGNYILPPKTEDFIGRFMAGKNLQPKSKAQPETEPDKKSSPPSPRPIKGRFVPGEERAKRRKASQIGKS